MNIFKKVAFIKRIEKAIKNSKKLIDSKKDLAEKVKKHLNNICNEVQELVRILPDFRNVYLEIIEIIDNIKWKNFYKLH